MNPSQEGGHFLVNLFDFKKILKTFVMRDTDCFCVCYLGFVTTFDCFNGRGLAGSNWFAGVNGPPPTHARTHARTRGCYRLWNFSMSFKN